ncbi:hypothetical protein HNQ64_003815 [Prosthecobacter dejongeii]|uniref:Uncharacterized protein n=1 Tax=Prosthecobacter dejongeii TaxID=48465 RepID=A0A7W7YP35_9BACT|nr:hypothetical protein [Prosthecobacter dejongeii]
MTGSHLSFEGSFSARTAGGKNKGRGYHDPLLAHSAPLRDKIPQPWVRIAACQSGASLLNPPTLWQKFSTPPPKAPLAKLS